MLVKDLIKQLQDLIEQHKPMEEQMGECEIMFDYYEEYDQNEYNYAGFVPDAFIDYTSDGVYPVLIAVSDKEKAIIKEREKKVLDKQD